MKKAYKSLVGLLLLALLALPLFGCASPVTEPQAPVSPGTSSGTETPQAPDGTEAPEDAEPPSQEPQWIAEDGRYYTVEDVAEYLHTFGKLPGNYITKDEAEDLGWVSSRGNLWEVTDRMVIGGDRFGNREGLLPARKGRTWYECDVNYEGGYRDGERIVFSNDGLIYYTRDHYASFEKLY